MTIFPKVEKHCPLKSDFKSYMDGDTCRMCKRQVHDLSAMDESGRVEFLASCETEICVSYSLPKPRTVAAAVAAAALMGIPIASHASESTPPATTEPVSSESPDNTEDGYYEEDFDWIIVGGIKDVAEAEYIDTEVDLEIPELPVIFEDETVESEATPLTKPEEEKI